MTKKAITIEPETIENAKTFGYFLLYIFAWVAFFVGLSTVWRMFSVDETETAEYAELSAAAAMQMAPEGLDPNIVGFIAGTAVAGFLIFGFVQLKKHRDRKAMREFKRKASGGAPGFREDVLGDNPD